MQVFGRLECIFDPKIFFKMYILVYIPKTTFWDIYIYIYIYNDLVMYFIMHSQ